MPDLSGAERNGKTDQTMPENENDQQVPAAAGPVGHVFTEEGREAEVRREQLAALAKELEATSEQMEKSVDSEPEPAAPEETDSEGDDGDQAELISGLSLLTEELESRLSDDPPVSPSEASPKQDLLSAPPEADPLLPPAHPIRRLPSVEGTELADVELEYTSLFAEPDADGEQVLRIDTPQAALQVLEGFLFVTAEPLSLARLSKLTGLTPECIEKVLSHLSAQLNQSSGALKLQQVAGGFQLGTREDLAEWMLRLQKQRRRPTLSNPALETLAIVAYRQPITRGEIEAIRGVDSSGPLRALQDLGLAEIGGRKDVVGRPSLFITTELFLKTFNLMTLEELPPIAELKRESRNTIPPPKVVPKTPAAVPVPNKSVPDVTVIPDDPIPDTDALSDIHIDPESPEAAPEDGDLSPALADSEEPATMESEPE